VRGNATFNNGDQMLKDEANTGGLASAINRLNSRRKSSVDLDGVDLEHKKGTSKLSMHSKLEISYYTGQLSDASIYGGLVVGELGDAQSYGSLHWIQQ